MPRSFVRLFLAATIVASISYYCALYLNLPGRISGFQTARTEQLRGKIVRYDDCSGNLSSIEPNSPNRSYSWENNQTGKGVTRKIILVWLSDHRRNLTQVVPVLSPHARERCLLTWNHCLVEKADVIAVVDIRYQLRYHEFPPIRHPWQYYLFVDFEPPSRFIPRFANGSGLFNWTMSYRLDSTFDRPYGRLIKRDQPSNDTGFTKHRPVVAMMSNCVADEAPSRRYEFVKELQKFINVDVIGKCGKLHCPRRPQAKCELHMERNYFFYLALENSICEDYVTEKLFQTLSSCIVPIVFSRRIANRFVDNSSFIAVDDFKTVKDLAGYLKSLSQNPQAYAKYFSWKRNYRMGDFLWKRQILWPPQDLDFSSVCERLHQIDGGNSTFGREEVGNLTNWWVTQANCQVYAEGKVY